MKTKSIRNSWLRCAFLGIIAALLVTPNVEAQQAEGYGKLMVFKSWEALLDLEPDTVIINAHIKAQSDYDFEFSAPSDTRRMRKMLKEETVAVCAIDSLWFVNSDWLKKHFKGDCKHFARYVPLFYTGKIAFAQFRRNKPTVGGFMLNLLLDGVLGGDTGIGMGDGYNDETPKFYWIDFDTQRVRVVNRKLLLELLEPYPDLLQRYSFRENQEETYLINEYFIEYVKRLDSDPYVPYLF